VKSTTDWDPIIIMSEIEKSFKPLSEGKEAATDIFFNCLAHAQRKGISLF